MFSRILIKLIDQSIVPALLLVTTKVLSSVLVARYFGIDFTLGPQGFVYTNVEDYLTINSYSIFFMIVAVATGIFYILLKSLIFHDTHIAPNVTARLFSLKLSHLIQASYDLYSQGTIWISYLYLLTLSSGVLALFNMIYPWVFWVSFVLSILSTVVLIFDIENELDLRSPKQPDASIEEVVLNLKHFDE